MKATGSTVSFIINRKSMAAASTPAVPDQPSKAPLPGPVPFDFSQPPVIEGFSPLPKIKEETFKEKFIRKTKENPFVPIGELHKQGNTVEKLHKAGTSRPSPNNLINSMIYLPLVIF